MFWFLHEYICLVITVPATAPALLCNSTSVITGSGPAYAHGKHFKGWYSRSTTYYFSDFEYTAGYRDILCLGQKLEIFNGWNICGEMLELCFRNVWKLSWLIGLSRLSYPNQTLSANPIINKCTSNQIWLEAPCRLPVMSHKLFQCWQMWKISYLLWHRP